MAWPPTTASTTTCLRSYLPLAVTDILVSIIFDVFNVFAKEQPAEFPSKFLLLFGGLPVPLRSQGEPGYPLEVEVLIDHRSDFFPAGLGVLRVFLEYPDNLVRTSF